MLQARTAQSGVALPTVPLRLLPPRAALVWRLVISCLHIRPLHGEQQQRASGDVIGIARLKYRAGRLLGQVGVDEPVPTLSARAGRDGERHEIVVRVEHDEHGGLTPTLL